MSFFKPGGIVPMKTLDEWFPSGRGDGRKFVCENHTQELGGTWFEPIFKSNSGWEGLVVGRHSLTMYTKAKFREWHAPKTRNKIMMYRAIIKVTPRQLDHGFKAADPFYAITNNWTSSKSTATGGTNQVVGFQEMEVEVDE